MLKKKRTAFFLNGDKRSAMLFDMTTTEKREAQSSIKTFIGALLVGGTALGAGMLALPVATAGGGLVPSWCIYIVSWLFGMSTGLLFVEIGMWLKPGANIVTMATIILGHWGRKVVWILYIFLFYFLTIAYVAGGGSLLSQITLGGLPGPFATVAFTLFFSIFVYLGTKVAGKMNAILMAGLVVTYIVFIAMGSTKMDVHLFDRFGWKNAILGLPIIFTSFSFQGVIPSLLEYLNRDAKACRTAIIYGTTIPFIAYIFWDMVIKGIIPLAGPHGLYAAQASGQTAVSPLLHFLPGSPVTVVANVFAFFALTTSFIGVTLGLLDFLADSLGMKKVGLKKLSLCAVIYIPPVVISLINPTIFLRALGLAGGFGCAILLGFMPVLMVWMGRYKQSYGMKHQQLFGGRGMLVLLMAFVAVEVIITIIGLTS